jgi:(E)-4-hydroxy-3-methylbut-2-enyl-diphosphate synthase
LIACPSCSRQNFDVISTVNALEQRLEDILEPLDVAVIGCVVNGPGEAREADIGLTGGQPNLLYVGGKPDHKVDDGQLVDELERVIREEVNKRQQDPEYKARAQNAKPESSEQNVSVQQLTG